MPRKTKETIEEKNVKKQSKSNKKITPLVDYVSEPTETVVDIDKPVKKTRTKSTSTTEKKPSTAKSNKATVKEKTTKTVTKASAKKATPKKVTTAKNKAEEVAQKKTTKKTVKEDSTIAKKSITKKTTKSPTTRAAARTKATKVTSPTVVEYYDLPYKYNQTVVKVLYQNPTTLFVYWEISDGDIENYKKTYGDNFFETTRPVLVVHNDTMNYNFEVNINDFANSWYFNINDSKCDYHVELIRKPISYSEKIKADYVHITSSNRIETPNDRILFSTNEPYTVYFKNTKNNIKRKVNLPKLLEKLNLSNKDFGFPIVRNVYDLYRNIYHIEDVGEFSVSLTNPSSGNPSSHSLSSRFI